MPKRITLAGAAVAAFGTVTKTGQGKLARRARSYKATNNKRGPKKDKFLKLKGQSRFSKGRSEEKKSSSVRSEKKTILFTKSRLIQLTQSGGAPEDTEGCLHVQRENKKKWKKEKRDVQEVHGFPPYYERATKLRKGGRVRGRPSRRIACP